MLRRGRRLVSSLRRELGRIRVRLLVVTLLVLVVPVAGLEFARIHERQLLESLERDMRDQALVVRAFVEADLGRGVVLDGPRYTDLLAEAARGTRTRVRILDANGVVSADSHRDGPPEGPEPAPPRFSRPLPSIRRHPQLGAAEPYGARSLGIGRERRVSWPAPGDRREVREALDGHPSAFTRVRDAEPAVLLFVTEPIRRGGEVVGVVYVVRSTQPVLVELHRIRGGLLRVLAIAVLFTLLVTFGLSWSISRPLSKLSRAAQRIAHGERDVDVPVAGGGELSDLGEAVRAMTEELSARAESSRDLAADVAHEFKSPLTSIRGAAELLADGADDDPKARARFLENIRLDADRLDRLVSRLLELGRIEASREAMTAFDLEATARRVCEREETPDCPVTLRWNARTRMVRAREADVETALKNLLENAVRFSPDGVGVDVEVSTREDRDAERYVMTVLDRGAGITDANRARVFERFFTTTAQDSGTGLGLAIVRSVATAHGGDVDVESARGRTAFTLTLPTMR